MGIKRWILPPLILLIGAAFRFHALAHDTRFHPDEALFATFARKAAVNGDWLLHGSLDKTPLSIYANAVSMMLVGGRALPNGVLTLDVHAGEFAARAPGTLASIVLIGVMYALAKQLYGQNSALIAAFLMAVSPYALTFSATAFTDGLMLLCITLSLWLASRGHWLWAGVWLALGYACKQQALFYLPLVMAVGTRSILSPRNIIRFALPMVLGFALLAAWDAARAQDTGLWALAVANNDPGRLIYPDELFPRLRIWATYGGNLIGAGWLTALLTGIAIIAVIRRVILSPHERTTRVDLILLLYIVGYLLLHWLVALPIHDRYLLPILPPVILLVAQGIEQILKGITQRVNDTKAQSLKNLFVPLSLCVLVLCFFPSALDVTEGRINVGGDRGKHDGIDQLGAYLNSKPLGTIIYDHWLGWELGYYLGTWSNKRLTYYPHAGALAADATAQADPAPRYFPAPARAAVEPWLDALAAKGFKIDEDYRSPKFVVYRLIPP